MTLIPIETPEDFVLAEQFVKMHEITSVSLASLVRRKSENLFFITNCDEGQIPAQLKDVLGLIDFDNTVYHCIPNPALLDQNQMLSQTKLVIKKNIRCISGESKATDFLVSTFSELSQKQTYNYKMMQFAPETPQIPLQKLYNGDQIIRCTQKDMEILSPLQKEYMKEEVAVPGRAITDAEVSMMLRQILKKELCLALVSDDQIVAKANTNAIGFSCVQIGGVFTHPLFRRNGYAQALVQELCRRIIKAKKTPVLFVKQKNLSAFSLYQKIGFHQVSEYKIVYF